VGWNLLETVLHVGTVVSAAIWFTTRAKQSPLPLQHGLLGATIAFALASAVMFGIFAFETFPLLFWFGALVGASIASIAAFVLVRIRRKYSPLADEDALIMQQRIHVIGIHACGGPQNLTKDAPFVEFEVTLINASVFGITWERDIEGCLRIDDEPQEEDTLKPRKTQEFYAQRGKHVSRVMRQQLTSGIAKAILERDRDVHFEFSGITLCFSFNHRGKPQTFETPLSFRNSYVTWDRGDGRMKSAHWE
jgi:phosphate/sulfate permease